jgi:hypothetical protein
LESADNRDGGIARPRFAARRRIPAHAFGLKKNLGGTGRVSKTSDNEHTTASLGHSEVLSVKHAVGEPIPELAQRPEDGAHVPSVSRRQEARDVFDDNPPRSEFVSESHEFVKESATLARETGAAPGDAEVLTRETSRKNVNWCNGVS